MTFTFKDTTKHVDEPILVTAAHIFCACRVVCTKVVGATSSGGFLVCRVCYGDERLGGALHCSVKCDNLFIHRALDWLLHCLIRVLNVHSTSLRVAASTSALWKKSAVDCTVERPPERNLPGANDTLLGSDPFNWQNAHCSRCCSSPSAIVTSPGRQMPGDVMMTSWHLPARFYYASQAVIRSLP